MSMKNLLFLFFLISGLKTGFIDCFLNKDLEESELKGLEATYTEYKEKMPEYEKVKILEKHLLEKQRELATQLTFCHQYLSNSWAGWFMGATENDCVLAEQYKKEWKQTGALLQYAQRQLEEKMSPEMKNTREFILRRRYEEMEVPNKSV